MNETTSGFELGHRVPAEAVTRRLRDEIQKTIFDAPRHCQSCGCEIEPATDTAIKRGAILLVQGPLRIFWRGLPVPLSPTEAVIVDLVVRRGRASFDAIGAAIRDFGSRAETRAVLLWRIRRKFASLGAACPFETVGNVGLRFVAEPDENDSLATIVGLRKNRA